MRVNDFTRFLSMAVKCDEIYVTDQPEIHKEAGGIVIAAFETLVPVSKTECIIRRFTIMAGKQAEGIGMPIVSRVERPEWFGPLWEYSQTLKAESAEKPGWVRRFFRLIWEVFDRSIPGPPVMPPKRDINFIEPPEPWPRTKD